MPTQKIADVEILQSSGLFDEEFYLSSHQDIRDSGVDALVHYVEYGSAEGRMPNREFDPELYLLANPDVAVLDLEPLYHYITQGRAERRALRPEAPKRGGAPSSPGPAAATVEPPPADHATPPQPSETDAEDAEKAEQIRFRTNLIAASGEFDPAFYGAASNLPEGADLISHYVESGWRAGLRPNPQFDPAFYLAVHLDISAAGEEPFCHYLSFGRSEERASSRTDPCFKPAATEGEIAFALSSKLFDEQFYRKRTHALPVGADPLEHYLAHGAFHHVQPSEQFDPVFYYSTYPEARASALPPLIHYIRHGRHSGLKIMPEDTIHWMGGDEFYGNNVHIERLRAQDFEFRYGLTPTKTNITPYAEAAVAEIAGLRSEPLAAARPTVSIIVPVYGQLAAVLACLQSLANHLSHYAFEVIVMDDASPRGEGIDRLASIPWIRLISETTNRGFIGACNFAAAEAQGEYVVLLNSDTRVCMGWLDELIGSFTIFPRAGLVGSKLYNRDGSLQEAGGIIWSNGAGWNFGRGDSPSRDEYSFARQVDYCSGAAIAIRTDVWSTVAGFDPFFAPAYYEDVDLAFRIRQAGYETWFQPLAGVIHYEGVTHGQDVTKGVKAFQPINERKFFDRWQATLQTFGRQGEAPLRASNRSAKKIMLSLDAETPSPDRDAGSVMTVKLLHIYQSLGWHIVFMPTHNPSLKRQYTADLQRVGIQVMSSGQRFDVPHFMSHLAQTFDALLGFRVTVLDGLVAPFRALFPSSLVLFHDIDLHYLRTEREAQLTKSKALQRQAQVYKEAELRLVTEVDCTIVPSTIEKSILQQEIAAQNVVVYSYTADPCPTPAVFEDRTHVVFIGGFRHAPNVDAVGFFIRDIWPNLIQHLPRDAKFYVVGSDAPEELLMLANERVVFTGYVEDLAPLLDTCRVFAAPLRYGAGLKGKVVTSLSFGLPCVATGIAIEGMELVSGVHVMQADGAPAIAEEIIALYADEEKWKRLRSNGLAFVVETYSMEVGAGAAQEILDVAHDTWMARRAREQQEWRQRTLKPLLAGTPHS